MSTHLTAPTHSAEADRSTRSACPKWTSPFPCPAEVTADVNEFLA